MFLSPVVVRLDKSEVDLRISFCADVGLLSQPQFNPVVLDDFLRKKNMMDATELRKEASASALAEASGRICYMSFEKPRPGGSKAYHHHVLEVGHGCYDAETEVLTEQGWKKWEDVTDSDKLATRDKEGYLEYQQPTALISYYYSGRMYRVESRHVDLLVTPNHNMLVCPTTTKEGRKKQDSDYSLIKAEDLGHKSHAYVKSADWRISGHSPHPFCFWQFLGFTIGDGSLGAGRVVRFHLRRERKILYLRSLCRLLGWELREPGNDKYYVQLPDDTDIRQLFSSIYDENREKVIPQQLLTSLTKLELEGLYDGLMQSDGTSGRTCDSFDTTSRTLAGQFQQLCLHIGIAANVCYEYTSEQRPTSYGEKTLIRLTPIRGYLKPEVNKWAGCGGKTSWIERWEGDVYCAEVPNHTLYVRRNGIPVWCGNSVVEHGNYSFLIHGVSRSLTHELIRHRAGWAYSQLSQRFVDEKQVSFVVPPKMLEAVTLALVAPEANLLFEIQHKDREFFQTLPEKYSEIKRQKLQNIGLKWLKNRETNLLEYRDTTDALYDLYESQKQAMSPTDFRKMLRQTARNCLPNCTETYLVATANIRALRHMIAMRGAKAADEEIRNFALRIAAIMKEAEPLLFQDLTIEEDHCFFKYPKV